MSGNLPWLLLALALTTMIYLPGLEGGFLFDDSHTIYENSSVNPAELNLDSLKRAAGSFAAGGRPISMVSFALNSYFFGPMPYSFKLFNLILHLFNGILIYTLTSLMLKAYARYLDGPELPRWTAVAVTAIWLVNPMQLTTVLYVVQRMAGLASFFTLCGLIAYTHGRMRQREGREGMVFIIAGLAGGTLLGILSKENGILLIPFAFLVELVFFRFRTSEDRVDWPMVLLLIILPLIAAGYLFTHRLSPDRILAAYQWRDFTLQERLLTEARVLWFYIRLILLPDNRLLGLWHDDIPLSESILVPVSTLPAVVGLVAMFVLAIAFIRKLPLLAFGILWFFIAHSIESSFIALEIAHEHRNYLASYGILLACTIGLILLLQHHSSRRLVAAIILMISSVFAYVTFERSQTWADAFTHALMEAEHHPRSPRAVFEAGRKMLILSLRGHPEYRKRGFEYFERAAKLDKTGINPNLSLMVTAEFLGVKQKDWWFREAGRKLQRYPVNASDIRALRTLLDCQQEKTCHIPHHRALQLFVLAAKDNDPEGLTMLGFYEANVLERYSYAKDAFEAAVKHNPGQPTYRLNYASLLVAGGEYESAEEQLRMADSLDRYGRYRDKTNELRAKIEEQKKNDGTNSAAD